MSGSTYTKPSRYSMLPEWVLYHPDLKDSDVRVYCVMARMADGDGQAYPKARTVADKLGVSDDTVRRSVARLEAVGAVRVEPMKGPLGYEANHYIIAGDTPLSEPLDPRRAEQKEAGRVNGRKSADTPPLRMVADDLSANVRTPPTQDCGNKEREPLNENQGMRCPTAVEPPTEFDTFWNAYGYKQKRKDAEAAFTKARKKVPLDAILDALPGYEDHLRRTGYDKALAASWLNAERWNDEYGPKQTAAPVNPLEELWKVR